MPLPQPLDNKSKTCRMQFDATSPVIQLDDGMGHGLVLSVYDASQDAQCMCQLSTCA